MMKKMLLVSMSLITLTGTLVAQNLQEEQKTQQNAVVKNEHLVMKDGKMCHNMNGKEMQMQDQITLHNGTVMHSNGSYQLKNGKLGQLRNGQCMDMNGRKYSSTGMLQKRMMGRHNMGNNKRNMHNNKNDGKMMGTGSSHH
jgi:hypothetical protein